MATRSDSPLTQSSTCSASGRRAGIDNRLVQQERSIGDHKQSPMRRSSFPGPMACRRLQARESGAAIGSARAPSSRPPRHRSPRPSHLSAWCTFAAGSSRSPPRTTAYGSAAFLAFLGSRLTQSAPFVGVPRLPPCDPDRPRRADHPPRSSSTRRRCRSRAPHRSTNGPHQRRASARTTLPLHDREGPGMGRNGRFRRPSPPAHR